jgi:hypothetical protein
LFSRSAFAVFRCSFVLDSSARWFESRSFVS